MAKDGGRANNAMTDLSKTIETTHYHSNMIANGSSMTTTANEKVTYQPHYSLNDNINETTTTIINPATLQTDVVETPAEDEDAGPEITTTAKPIVEEAEAAEPQKVEESEDSGTLTEASQVTEAPSQIMEAPTTAGMETTEAPTAAEISEATDAPVAEPEVSAPPEEAATRPPAEPMMEPSEEVSGEVATMAPTLAPIAKMSLDLETTTMPTTQKEEITTEPTTTSTTTAEPSKDPYAIEIPLEKKISKRVQRKLWEEIEKRKPLIPKHVALHIQKYAKPPFETWGCKFRSKGSCFSCR